MPYNRINWKNGEAGNTPLNQTNLNHMEDGIKANEGDIAENKSAIDSAELAIDALQLRPTFAIVNTSKSPLKDSGSSNILAIDALGNSKQYISPNFIQGTDDWSGTGWNNTSYYPTDGTKYNGLTVRKATETWHGLYKNFTAEAGKTYTISAYVKGSTANCLAVGYLSGLSGNSIGSKTIGTSWQRVSFSYTPTASGTLGMRIESSNDPNLSICGYMITTDGSTEYQPYSTPTPETPVPIVDASGEILAHARNMWDEVWELGAYDVTTGAKTANANNIRNANLIKITPGASYVFKKPSSQVTRVVFFDGRKNQSSYIVNSQQGDYAFTAPSNAEYMAFYFGATTYNHDAGIFEGSSAEYEPYKSNSVNLENIGIVLRSIKDIRDELVIEEGGAGKHIKKAKIIDLGDYSYGYNAEQNYFYTSAQITDKKVGSYAMLCNKYKIFNSTANMPDKSLTSGYSNNYIFIKNTDYGSDVNAIKNALKGTVLYYELATPIVTELTREQVRQILALRTYRPETYIDSDLDVTITYAGDPKAYIEKSNIYTAEERLIGEYLGHPLYRKSYKTKTPIAPNSIGLIVEDDFSDKKVVNLYGVYGGYSFQMPINRYDTSYTWVEYNGIKMHIAGGHTNYECYVTVEYFYEDYEYHGYIPEEEPQPVPLALTEGEE